MPDIPEIMNPTSPEKIADTWEELQKLKKQADLNQDGKLSAYEIMNAFITMPKFFALLVSFIMSVYAAVAGVQAFITKELNILTLVVALCIVVFFIIMYVVLSNLGKAQITTMKNLNENWNDRELKKEAYITRLEKDRMSDKDEIQAWKTKASVYKYQAVSYQNRHPNDQMPDITTVDD